MNQLVREIGDQQLRKDIPEFRAGDTVRVHVKVVEGQRERIQVFEGVVIQRRGGGISRRSQSGRSHITSALNGPSVALSTDDNSR